ncbi:sensor histidine kinase [Telluribacter sp. SYSU D00476]|uniref:sensor histidine kinase n=1 Tax=Telluribacter sp. SYSU D00476 TaxID=2811430 RepID=UPI001FF2F5BF|nr:histidine kinase [Telluribacter sp. SYSU D00476]
MAVTHTSFFLSDRPAYRLRRHLTFWVVVVMFFTVVSGTGYMGIEGRGKFPLYIIYKIGFLETMIVLPVMLFLCYFSIYLVIPRFLLKGKYSQLLISVVGTLVLATILYTFLAYFLLVPLRTAHQVPGANLPFLLLSMGLLSGFRGGIAVAGLAVAIKLTKQWYFQNQQYQQLESERLKAELQLLKAQLHPHFLFNTLNNLYSLTLIQSEKAPDVVLKISSLLRHVLYECDIPKVPLRKEVKLIQDYVELEKDRYGNRLDVSMSISDNLNNKVIAPLLLIPFIENSFKHGISEQLDFGWINLELTVQGNTMKFKLMNSISENSPEYQASISPGGIGLENVRKRLELVYPNKHELKVISENGMYMVSLVLELEEEKPEHVLSNTNDPGLITTSTHA